MRISLIGPTYPFRGGISHYTTLLCRELRRNHSVQFLSFSRQYPGILFPGKSDRDDSKNPITVNNVRYPIDSVNPLTWMKTAREIINYNPDLVIFPWWVAFWAPQFWTILRLIRRKRNLRITFICHNVVEHESNKLKKFVTRTVLSLGDRFITHSIEETDRLRGLLGKEAEFVTAFHPTYSGLDDNRYTKEEAKKTLGMNGNVMLFFGFVREYKGLHVLLDALPLVFQKTEATLLVVGEFWKDKELYLEQIARYDLSSRVQITDKYVPNEKIGLYFCASDLVVQPYLSASGSGISQIAYGFDRPVIATNVGSLPEVIQDGENGRIVPAGNAHALALAIVESLQPQDLARLSAGASQTKKRFSWEKMGKIVIEGK